LPPPGSAWVRSATVFDIEPLHRQDGGLFAEDPGRLGFEFEHRRITVTGIVAEPGRHNALEHLGRWQRQRVASKIQ